VQAGSFKCVLKFVDVDTCVVVPTTEIIRFHDNFIMRGGEWQ